MQAGVLRFRLRQFWFVIAALALSAAETRGDYPRRGADSVVDTAHLLTAGDAATLRSEIASFKARTGTELVVFTLPSYLASERGTRASSDSRLNSSTATASAMRRRMTASCCWWQRPSERSGSRRAAATDALWMRR